MSRIILPNRWKKQPGYAARIDYSHPANRRGVELSFNPAAGLVNLATGTYISKSAGVTLNTTPRGYAYDFAAASGTNLNIFSGNHLTVASGVVVFDARDLSNAVTTVGRLFSFGEGLVMLAGDDGGTFDNCISFFIQAAGNNCHFIHNGFVDGGKYTVAFSWSGGTSAATDVNFGIDGVVSGPTSTTGLTAGGLLNNAVNRHIGNRSGGDRPFDGLISLVHIVPDVWGSGLLAEISANPWQLYAPINRRVYFPVPVAADLDVEIDTPGGITVAGQSVPVNIGVAVAAGAINIAGQSAGLNVGVNLEAGSITFQGEDSTLEVSANLFAAIDTPGEITIQGEDATIEVGANLFAVIDTPGSITIDGQDAEILLEGDIVIDLDVAGSITIAGQACDITLTEPSSGGRGRGRRTIKPAQLPPITVEGYFLQPWQMVSADVEISDEVEGTAEQGPTGIANSAVETSDEVRGQLEQGFPEVAALLSAIALRGVVPPVGPVFAPLRLQARFEQPPAELEAEVEIV